MGKFRRGWLGHLRSEGSRAIGLRSCTAPDGRLQLPDSYTLAQIDSFLLFDGACAAGIAVVTLGMRTCPLRRDRDEGPDLERSSRS